MMFDSLDRIDWTSLGHHVYGKPEQIPGAVRSLLSDDPEVRQDACDFLLGGGQDFGDIYDTTPHIIPFLFEILDSPDAPGRDELLLHLSGTAEHISYPGRSSVHMLRLRLRTYDAFKAGLGIVIALLDDPSMDVRLASAELLQYLTDEVESLIPELIRHFREEREEDVQVAVLRTLKRLLGSLEWPHFALKGQYAPFFKETIETHSSHKVRVAAARASVELVNHYNRKQDDLSPQVPTILSQEFLKLGSPLDYQESGSSSHHAEMVAKDLSRLDPEPLLHLLQDPAIGAERAHWIARALLANLFLHAGSIEAHWEHFPNYDKKAEGKFYLHHYSVIRSLRMPHHTKDRFLQAIVDADKVWEIPTNLFSCFYGLPDSREALQALLKANSKA
jgi:hypothetical protein